MNLKDTYSKAFDELEHDLRRDIYRRQMLPGEKLSSELQLARKYRISRSTVRKALDSLAEDAAVGRNGTPGDVAQAMAYLADASFVTGQVLPVNGGLII